MKLLTVVLNLAVQNKNAHPGIVVQNVQDAQINASVQDLAQKRNAAHQNKNAQNAVQNHHAQNNAHVQMEMVTAMAPIIAAAMIKMGMTDMAMTKMAMIETVMTEMANIKVLNNLS